MQPDRIKVGAAVVLLSLDGVSRDWGIPERGVRSLLATFSIPVIKFPGGEKYYVSMYSLEDALFEAGLPSCFKGNKELVRTHHELAGVLYGTLSKEVIRERVKALARSLKAGPPKPPRRKPGRPRVRK